MRRALVHYCLGNNRLVRSSSPPSPPRSLVQTEISRLVANSPELAGIRVILSLQAVDWISRAVLAPLSLPRKIAFPDRTDVSVGPG
jgi:hypothetical protein